MGKTVLTSIISALMLAGSCTPHPATVRGHSMVPVLVPGQEVLIEPIGCVDHKPQTGDLILFDIAGRPRPIVKQVAGLPGAFMKVTKSGEVFVDGHPVIGLNGTEYRVSGARQTMLELYQGRLRGYLVIGAPGALDSSRIGLIAPQDLVGFVVLIRD